MQLEIQTSSVLETFVAGKAAPQGSKRHVGNGVMVESSKELEPWRESIRAALRDRNGYPKLKIDGAAFCSFVFIMPRPASTPKRKTPPAVKRPDLDKLVRAVFDAIQSAGVVNDDSQIIGYTADKRLARLDEVPGLKLRIAAAEV